MIWPSSMFFRSIFSAAIVFFYQASLAGQNGYYLFSIDSENTRNGHGLVGSKSRPASVAVKVSPFNAQVTRPIGNFHFCRSTSRRRDVWVCPEFRVWLPSAARFLDGSFGRAVHLACPAGFIAELPFERWLRRMTDKPVLWLTACEHDHPHQLFAVQAEHMTPINSQGVKDGNHPKTRSLE